MSAGNPYDATRTPVADVERDVVKRPWHAMIALVILWILLAAWTMGVIARCLAAYKSHALDPLYVAYLGTAVFVPACLLVMIAQARGWARTAALVFYVADFLFRIYLASFDAAPADSRAWIFVPAVAQLFAFLLLYLPPSNTWFRASRP